MVLPGFALALTLALLAAFFEPYIAVLVPLPAMVIALMLGIALNKLASHPAFAAGVSFCVKQVLRVAIALLGIRISFLDLRELGVLVPLLIILAMAITLFTGIWTARRLKLDLGYGALAGAATAVCGASAALATATVVPDYPRKAADVTFTVVAANAASTLVMVLYPPIANALGLEARATGILLGATIHDMAQVVGAGYAVSEDVGNTAVIVKLFRVLLLLPVVMAIGWWLRRQCDSADGTAKVPVPVFALVFIVLCALNSLIPHAGADGPLYQSLRSMLIAVSSWGMLIAIVALGLGTSVRALSETGWRHLAVFTATTFLLFAVMAAGLRALA
jgi:uncharacterized integral membrane protein (TIGR00698 family)